MRNEIKTLTEAIDDEKKVSKKIQEYIAKKKGIIEETSEVQDKLREKKVNDLGTQKEEIQNQQEEANNEINAMAALCEEENEVKKQQDLIDEENAEAERKKL